MVLCIVDGAQRQILVHQLAQRLSDLIFLAFLTGGVRLIEIRYGDLGLLEDDGLCLGGQGVAGSAAGLTDGADITRLQLGNFFRLAAAQDIQFAQLFLVAGRRVEQHVVGLDDAGADLDQRIFAHERIDDGLEDIRGLGSLRIEISLELSAGLVVLAGKLLFVRSREQFDDIVEDVMDVQDFGVGAHGDRHGSAVMNALLVGADDLFQSEGITVEVTVHIFIIGLGDRFHHGVIVGFQIVFQISRHVALDALAGAGELAGSLLRDVDVTDQLVALTDRDIERNDLLAIALGQLFNDLVVVDVLSVHLVDDDHARQTIFLAQLPGLLSTDFDAGLAGNDDDRGIRDGDCLFDFTDEIKETGGVQEVDLDVLPLDRNDRGVDGEFTADLFFIVITDGVAVSHFADAARNTCNIGHSLDQTGLATATMS